MEFDEVFQYIGDVGTYQLTLYFMLVSIELVAVDAIGMNFMGGNMKHWCNLDVLQNFSFAQQKYLAIPEEGTTDGGQIEFTSCHRFPIDFSNYSVDELLRWNRTAMTGHLTPDDWVSCDQGWVYDRSVFDHTVNSEWDLVCGRDWMREMISTVYMAGRLVGAITCGIVSDKKGRKTMMMIYHCIKVVGAALCFVNSYPAFCVGRFMMACGSTGSSLGGYILVNEMVGGKYRAVFGQLWGMLWSVGYMMNAGFGYFIRDYLKIQALQTIPLVVFFLFIPFAYESPRWLVSQGRYEDALKIIRRVAKINRTTLPDNFTFDVGKKHLSHHRGSFNDLFKTPNIRKKTLLMWLTWFTDSLMYFGLSLNAGSLVGSVFLNTFLQGLVEIPARIITLFLMDHVGRRTTVAATLLFGGLTSFLSIPFILRPDLAVGLTVMSMLGKASVTGAFSASYVYTLELFPTGIRNNAMGSASMLARVSGMAAPYMGRPMERVWRPMPSVIFGLFTTVCGSVLYTLPDTLHTKLPETLEEAEAFGRKSKRKLAPLKHLPEVLDMIEVGPTDDIKPESEMLARKPTSQNGLDPEKKV